MRPRRVAQVSVISVVFQSVAGARAVCAAQKTIPIVQVMIIK
jgi:hypothetical protein